MYLFYVCVYLYIYMCECVYVHGEQMERLTMTYRLIKQLACIEYQKSVCSYLNQKSIHSYLNGGGGGVGGSLHV